jgi:HEAT repeats
MAPALVTEVDVMKRFLPGVFAVSGILLVAEPAMAIDLNFGLFRKKTPAANSKADTSAKTKQLLATLASDTDVDHRKAAVSELKSVDPKSNADVISTLATALAKDPSADVRVQSAEVLGSYATVYQSAAKALEAAESGDPDKKVRAAAKAALTAYTKLGYQWSASTVEAKPSNEPPLAKRPATTTTTSAKMPLKQEPAVFKPITQGPAPKEPVAKPQTDEPPVLPIKKPAPKPAETSTVVVPNIMPAPDSKPAALPELPKNSTLTPKEFELPTIPTSTGTSSVPTVLPPGKK